MQNLKITMSGTDSVSGNQYDSSHTPETPENDDNVNEICSDIIVQDPEASVSFVFIIVLNSMFFKICMNVQSMVF